MIRILSAITLCFTFAQGAWAISYRGLATTPCEMFVELQSQEKKDWFPAKQWMYGYLTGLNVAFDYLRQENPMSQLEFDAVYDYSLRYCKENSEKFLIDALMSFTNELVVNK